LSIKIQEHFQFVPGWYCGGEVGGLVLQYYVVVRSVLRAKPCLRRCLTRCRQCRIFFLTHPCNAGRRDLRCPFGCQEGHRKRGSTERSVEYYRTAEGKLKKKMHNGRRGKVEAKAGGSHRQGESGQEVVLHDSRFDAHLVCYLQMVTSLIEGRRVSLAETLEMLARAVRQHSMVGRRRMDYVLQYLNEHAP